MNECKAVVVEPHARITHVECRKGTTAAKQKDGTRQTDPPNHTHHTHEHDWEHLLQALARALVRLLLRVVGVLRARGAEAFTSDQISNAHVQSTHADNAPRARHMSNKRKHNRCKQRLPRTATPRSITKLRATHAQHTVGTREAVPSNRGAAILQARARQGKAKATRRLRLPRRCRPRSARGCPPRRSR